VESIWTGLVFGPDGEPLACTRLRIVEVERSGPYVKAAVTWFETDRGGKFAVAPSPDFRDHAPDELRFDLPGKYGDGTPTDNTERPLASATVWLAEQNTPVESDLGEIRLSNSPFLASGRVVDEFGNPIEGAYVLPQFASDTPVQCTWTMPLPSETRGAVHVGRGDPTVSRDEEWHEAGIWWLPPEYEGAPSGADGSFELRGTAPGSVFRLEGYEEGLVVYETPLLAPGAKDVLVVLRHTGSLAGSIDCEGIILGNRLDVELIYREGTEPEGTRAPLVAGRRAEKDGRFDLAQVPAGVADLNVRIYNHPDPALVIPDVVIPIGEATEDPRLERIPIAEVLRTLRIRVVDEDGREIPQARAYYPIGRDGDRLGSAFGLHGQPLELYVPPGPTDVVVIARGFRQQGLEGIEEDRTVTLGEGIPITLSLAEDFERPETSRRLRVRLLQPSYRWETAQRLEGGRLEARVPIVVGDFDERDQLVLRVSAPGPYEVCFEISRGKSSARSPLLSGGTLEIPEGAERFFHTIEPDPVKLAELLAELDG